MPKPVVESPPEAIDKIYAQSLFELAEAQGGRQLLEELNDEMDQLEELRERDPQVAEFFRSLIIPGGTKVAVLKKSLEGRINPLLRNFMLLLGRKDRFSRVWQVFTAFGQLLQERFGKVEVDIHTRFALSSQELASITQTLRDAIKREPVVHAYIDETMIGGLRIQIGDKMLNASVEAQLRQMREEMNSNGAGRLRERLDGMFND